MKKAGKHPCLRVRVGRYFLASAFFLPSFLAAFLSPDFLSDFFSIAEDFLSMPFESFLSCATAAKLVAANSAATRTANSCFIVIPFSLWWFVERPATGGAVRSG